MSNLTKTSIIICTKNRATFLHQCLLSIKNQTLFPLEVIIIDNGSTDNTREVATIFSKTLPIKYYLYNINNTIPLVRNYGITKASGNLLIFIDDDCVAGKKLLATFVKKANKIKNSNQNFIIQGHTLNRNYQKDNLYATFLNLLGREGFNTNFSYDRKPKIVRFIDTKNVCFPKKTLNIIYKKYGYYFDKEMVIEEDMEFAMRIIKLGIKIYFEPNAKILHYEVTNIKDFCIKRFMRGRGANLSFNKMSKFYSIKARKIIRTTELFDSLKKNKKRLHLIAINNLKKSFERYNNPLFKYGLYVLFYVSIFSWTLGYWYEEIRHIFKKNIKIIDSFNLKC